MAGKHLVRLTIEVPENVEVVPVIVRKPGKVASPNLPTDRTVLKQATIDLTTAKAGNWLGKAPDPRLADYCTACCVRG